MIDIKLIPGADIEGQSSKEMSIPEFSDAMTNFIPGMSRVMHEKRGVALAAPQAGIFSRFFIMRFQNQSFGSVSICFNPTWVSTGSRIKTQERCLTYLMQAYTVKRRKSIRARFYNVDGQLVQKKLVGNDAFVFQQMCDLLNGKTIKTEAVG